MKRIIMLLLFIAILIPTTVNAQGAGEGVETVVIDGVEWELVEETWTWYRSDGSTYQQTVAVWQEVGASEYGAYPIQHYDPYTGKIVCWDACWHEVAHKLDHEVMDEISESPDFRDAIVDFLYQEMIADQPHPMAVKVLLFPGFFAEFYIFPDDSGVWSGYEWGGYDELYADILYWAGGDIREIPQGLRKFYNMGAAQQMYKEYPNEIQMDQPKE